MSNLLKAHIALFLANLIYAGNYTIAKEVMPDFIKPFGFILLRVTTAAIIIIILHQLVSKERIQKRDRFRFFLCGLFGVAINQLMFFKGLNWTTPIHASLIMTIVPIIVLMASAIIIKEKITPKKILGIILGGTGAILLITYGNQVTMSNRGLFGDLMILINASSFGIYLVLVKTLMSRYEPITVLKWIFIVGWILVAPFGIRELSEVNWSSFTTGIWISVFYVLLFVSVFAYFFNVFALKQLSPTIVSAYIYSQPLMAGAISILGNKEQLTLIMVISGILIFSGVYLVSIGKAAPGTQKNAA